MKREKDASLTFSRGRAEMVEDHTFLRREVEVCERCALLINKWAQFDQDPEERTKAKVAAILKH